MKFGLSDKQINEIVNVLASYNEIEEALLFGSRAMDTYKEASDIDIALKGKKADRDLALRVKEQLDEETSLPFFFDVVAYSAIDSEDLKEQIKRWGKVLYRKGWRWVKLRDVAIFNPLENIPKGETRKKVLMDDLSSFQRKISNYTKGFYKGGSKFRNGDTLLARITPCLENGKTAFVDILEKDEIGFGSTEFIVIRNKKNVTDKPFLFYLATSSYFRNFAIKSMTGSSGRQRVQTDEIINLEVFLPSIEEQKGIAEVLSSLDDKIELLHCQNRTLEDMAQCLFRKWFIEDADPTWPIGKLTSEFEFTMGTSPPGHSYNEKREGIPMFQGNADFGFRFPMNRIYTRMPKRFAKKFDTLISVRAPVGEQNMAKEKCCIGRGLAAFRYKHNNAYYTYTYFKIKSIIDKIKAFQNTGTVFGAINKKDFEDIEITIPPKRLILDFQNKVKPIDDKVILNEFNISNLENLRDMLLPKLINGAIRVQRNV